MLPGLPELIQKDQLAVEHFTEIRVLLDFQWFADGECWAQLIQINLNNSVNDDFPKVSNWYVVLTESYPLGPMYVFPASDDGIEYTMPHQELIEPYRNKKVPWKRGHICLSGEFDSLTRSEFTIEPKGIGRLAWVYARAIEWAIQASQNMLLKEGDRFELPSVRSNELDGPFVLTQETNETFLKWGSTSDQDGLIYGGTGSIDNAFYITSFRNKKDEVLVHYKWKDLEDKRSLPLGIWFKVPNLPTFRAWHTPQDWSQLIKTLEDFGIDLPTKIRQKINKLHWNKSFILGIGFPIPETMGDKEVKTHWYFANIPQLSKSESNGFRKQSLRKVALQNLIYLTQQSQKVHWLSTKNIDQDKMLSRGAYSESLRKKKILLIGCGALGSCVAELLARGGCLDLSLVDFDRMDVGNLARHTLLMNDLFKHKSKSLAIRLNNINPFLEVRYLPDIFNGSNHQIIEDCDLIIDCTAEDDVIRALTRYKKEGRIIASISLGFEAEKSYLNISNLWDPEVFHITFRDLILEDSDKLKQFSRSEGIGCWHYAFPASSGDIWAQASSCVELLDDALKKGNLDTSIVVEKHRDHSGYHMLKKRVLR